jgi:hypothetical protein
MTEFPITEIPRRSDGRKSWSALFATMKTGDIIRMRRADYPGIHSRANKSGMKVRCDMHHPDRTFLMTVTAGQGRTRHRILEALASLSDSKLTALWSAAVKGGIFTPTNTNACRHDAGHDLNGVGMRICKSCRADITQNVLPNTKLLIP